MERLGCKDRVSDSTSRHQSAVKPFCVLAPLRLGVWIASGRERKANEQKWKKPANHAVSFEALKRPFLLPYLGTDPFQLVVSTGTLTEYEARAPAVLAQESPRANARGALTWVRAKALWVEPAPLGKRRSRDRKDEPFIAAALGARAKAIVSYDDDLLTLEKPFGIPIMRPAAFLAWIEARP